MEKTQSNGKEKYWREKLSESEQFTGTVQEYCRSAGVSYHQLSYWRKRFKRDEKAARSFPEAPASRAFVPVQVASEITRSETSSRRAVPDPKWVADFIHHLLGVEQ